MRKWSVLAGNPRFERDEEGVFRAETSRFQLGAYKLALAQALDNDPQPAAMVPIDHRGKFRNHYVDPERDPGQNDLLTMAHLLPEIRAIYDRVHQELNQAIRLEDVMVVPEEVTVRKARQVLKGRKRRDCVYGCGVGNDVSEEGMIIPDCAEIVATLVYQVLQKGDMIFCVWQKEAHTQPHIINEGFHLPLHWGVVNETKLMLNVLLDPNPENQSEMTLRHVKENWVRGCSLKQKIPLVNGKETSL